MADVGGRNDGRRNGREVAQEREQAVEEEWKTYIMKRQPKWVFALCLVQWIIYSLAMETPGGGYLKDMLVFSGDLWYQPWRYFTVVLVHRDYQHLLGSCFNQVLYGVILEYRYGIRRFAAIYLLGAAGGTLVHSLCFSNLGGISFGASCATKAILFAHFWRVIHVYRAMWREEFNFALFLHIFYNTTLMAHMLIVFTGELRFFFETYSEQVSIAQAVLSTCPISKIQLVSHAGHLGGILVGLVLGKFLLRKGVEYVPSPDRNNNIIISKERIDAWNAYVDQFFLPCMHFVMGLVGLGVLLYAR